MLAKVAAAQVAAKGELEVVTRAKVAAYVHPRIRLAASAAAAAAVMPAIDKVCMHLDCR